MHETASAPTLSRAQAFPGNSVQVREARRFLAAILGRRRAADDAVLCLSELAANAIIHSRSGRPGGYFTVGVDIDSQRLRVEVCDEGGPWTWLGRGDERHGRGLLVVSQLARAWGRTGNSDAGWTVWFEMGCSDPAGGTARVS
jgi:serine/threonine-protein kinase RsbW